MYSKISVIALKPFILKTMTSYKVDQMNSMILNITNSLQMYECIFQIKTQKVSRSSGGLHVL